MIGMFVVYYKYYRYICQEKNIINLNIIYIYDDIRVIFLNLLNIFKVSLYKIGVFGGCNPNNTTFNTLAIDLIFDKPYPFAILKLAIPVF